MTMNLIHRPLLVKVYKFKLSYYLIAIKLILIIKNFIRDSYYIAF